MRTTILGFLLLLSLHVQAARPTVNANNLYCSITACTRANFMWSNGNGNARLIVAREGSPVAFVPTDNTAYYQYSSAFGSSTPPGIYNNEFLLFNGPGSSTLNITNLKAGTTYYITIYEHDNNGSNTLYLTSGAATFSFTTASINQSFNIKAIDSCQYSNSFEFTNTSTHNIPGLVFSFELENKTYNADKPLTYKYKTASGYANVILKNDNTYGCPTSLTQTVRIYPKKVVLYDFANSTDTVQDFIGNNFTMKLKGILMPFPLAVSYQWDDGLSNNFNFSTFKRKYPDPGRYHTHVITTININMQPTNCRDTMYLDLVVTGIKPFRNLSISPDWLPLKNNLFSFSLSDTGLSAVKWHFGDGNTSTDAVTTHTYQDTGWYWVKVVATNKVGLSDSTYKLLRVNIDGDTLSLSHEKIAVLSAFPIPASKQIDLQFRSLENYQIKLFQMDGKVCLEKTQTELKERLQIGDLASGNYQLGIYQNGSLIQTFNIMIDK